MNKALFICTGNYYRSRFAEALFNYHCSKQGLAWRAFSRGLGTHLINPVVDGTISPHTNKALSERKIPLTHTGERPVQLSESDLEAAALTIALKELEHRPLMKKLFPSWENKIRYWAVHDLDGTTPDKALPEIETLVLNLISTLKLNEQNG